MDFKLRPLNQSLISRFLYKGEEREDICPLKVFSVDIEKTHRYKTESMQKGSYFETLCIGKGAGGRITEDLPRKRVVRDREVENEKRKEHGLPIVKGDKTIDQIRIEAQAVRFKALAAKYQITILPENCQVQVLIPWHKNPDIHLSMEYDIFPTTIIAEGGLRLAIIDVKLTANIHSDFGEYAWGNPEQMDLIQSYMYHYGARRVIDHVDMNPHIKDLLTKPAVNLIKANQLDFFYWVFNYKKAELEDKLVKIAWDPKKEAELHESIRKTVSLIEYYELLQWPAYPDYNRCRTCPVFECDKRATVQTV